MTIHTFSTFLIRDQRSKEREKISLHTERINLQSRILYQLKIFFKNEGEIMTFSDERNKRIHCQQTCTTGNANDSSLG